MTQNCLWMKKSSTNEGFSDRNGYIGILFLKTKAVLLGTFIASNHFLKIRASVLLPV